jgi:hypothetical protein
MWRLMRVGLFGAAFLFGWGLTHPEEQTTSSPSIVVVVVDKGRQVETAVPHLRCSGMWSLKYARVDSTRLGSNCVPEQRRISRAASGKQTGLL